MTECLAILPIPKLPPPAPDRVRGPDRSSLHTERENSSVDGILEVIWECNCGGWRYRWCNFSDSSGKGWRRKTSNSCCMFEQSLCRCSAFLGLQKPESIRTKDNYGSYLLHIAICYHASASVIRCLLDKEPEIVCEKDDNGLTSLEMATQFNASGEVTSLLTRSSAFLEQSLPRA